MKSRVYQPQNQQTLKIIWFSRKRRLSRSLCLCSWWFTCQRKYVLHLFNALIIKQHKKYFQSKVRNLSWNFLVRIQLSYWQIFACSFNENILIKNSSIVVYSKSNLRWVNCVKSLSRSLLNAERGIVTTNAWAVRNWKSSYLTGKLSLSLNNLMKP